MANRVKPRNPYSVVNLAGQQRLFCGQQELLSRIENELLSTSRNLVVLFGERRIGKTSVLQQLRETLPPTTLLPAYLDLGGAERKPLKQVLAELGAALAPLAGVALPPQDVMDADEEGGWFQKRFLTEVSRKLGAGCRPVLLIDHADALSGAREREDGRSFLPYLKDLLANESWLRYVVAVGCRVEDTHRDLLPLLKDAASVRVPQLSESSARTLVTAAQRSGLLLFKEQGVERVLQLCGGHPYFIQLVCQCLFEDAYSGEAAIIHKIDASHVDAIAQRALMAAELSCEWIWESFQAAEQQVLCGIARATDERAGIGKERLAAMLAERHIALGDVDLDFSVAGLCERQVLRAMPGGHGFTVQLLRRWVAKNKPLLAGKAEEEHFLPVGERLFRIGRDLWQNRDAGNACAILEQALRLDPTHLQARVMIGEVLLEAGRLEESIRHLEEAHKQSAEAAAAALARTLLAQAEWREKIGGTEEALGFCRRALSLVPADQGARARLSAILSRRGEEALKAEDLDAALAAFKEAGEEGRAAQVLQLKHRRIVEEAAAMARGFAEKELWEQAIERYEWLSANEPEEPRWREELKRARTENDLTKQYQEGLAALSRGDREGALRILGGVLHLRPDYKDAAERLAQAAAGIREAPREVKTPRPVKETKVAARLPPPIPARRARGIYLGVAIGVLGSAGIGAAALPGLMSQLRPAPVPQAPVEDADTAAARVLLDVENDLIGHRWSEALARLERILARKDISAGTRLAATSKRERAEREQAAQQAFELFIGAGTEPYEVQLELHRKIPGDSVYQQLARDKHRKVVSLWANERLLKAETARTGNRCWEFRYWVTQVLAMEPAHAEALDMQKQGCQAPPSKGGGKRAQAVESDR